jgi:hypothetical protein
VGTSRAAARDEPRITCAPASFCSKGDERAAESHARAATRQKAAAAVWLTLRPPSAGSSSASRRVPPICYHHTVASHQAPLLRLSPYSSSPIMCVSQRASEESALGHCTAAAAEQLQQGRFGGCSAACGKGSSRRDERDWQGRRWKMGARRDHQ